VSERGVLPSLITRYECPIGPCPWTHDDPWPDALEGSGATVEEAAFDAMLKHVTRVESAVKAHLETRPLIEWVQEIQRLRAEHWRGDRDARVIAAILLRRLGGSAEIADAEMAAEQGTLFREPTAPGFRLSVVPR
jgi:hypothetical protein